MLDRLSWEVARGEHWVILGANGSGKTSLLSALAGYLTPTEGDITVLGETFGASDWRELRKHIGLVSSAIRQMVPEDEDALTTVVSGKDALIGFWGHTKTGERKTARSLLRKVEAEYLSARPWLVLSQGERQRVLIARALMARPRLLILDEPCAGLDPVAREQFLDFLDRLGTQRSAPALVLVTHHVEEIMPVFSHALLLREGRIIAAGERSRVLTSALLSKTFAADLRLAKRARRYTLATPLASSTRHSASTNSPPPR
ncbi:MAG: ABC transporter ATP-binding protein [Chthoniobacteraceae bacterium]